MWLVVALAQAKEPDLFYGGALDLSTAAFIPDSGPIITGAGWQAEGDLYVMPDGFRLAMELDFGGNTGPLVLGRVLYLSPERFSVRVGVKDFWFEGGVLPPPWGMEATDPWRNPLVSWSGLRRPGAGAIQGAYGPDGMVPLGSLIGGGLGLGNREWGLAGLAGLDLPTGMNLLGAPLEDIRNSTLLMGGYGWYYNKQVTINGGLYAHPFDGGPLTIDLGAQFRPHDVWITGEVVANLQGAMGLMVQGELLPGGVVSPVLQLEATQGEGPGAGLGVCSNPWEIVRLKAEVRYAQQTPSLWAEATLFTPELGSRNLRPGW